MPEIPPASIPPGPNLLSPRSLARSRARALKEGLRRDRGMSRNVRPAVVGCGAVFCLGGMMGRGLAWAGRLWGVRVPLGPPLAGVVVPPLLFFDIGWGIGRCGLEFDES